MAFVAAGALLSLALPDLGEGARESLTLLTELDLTDVTLIGFSMGGGEVVRYLGTYGDSRVKQAVLASAVPPFLYKSADNPDGGLDDDELTGGSGND